MAAHFSHCPWSFWCGSDHYFVHLFSLPLTYFTLFSRHFFPSCFWGRTFSAHSSFRHSTLSSNVWPVLWYNKLLLYGTYMYAWGTRFSPRSMWTGKKCSSSFAGERWGKGRWLCFTTKDFFLFFLGGGEEGNLIGVETEKPPTNSPSVLRHTALFSPIGCLFSLHKWSWKKEKKKRRPFF